MEITLEDLLESRDRRAERQRLLLGQYPGKTLLCLTVIMPGKVKRNLHSLVVAGAALSAVAARFGDEAAKVETYDLPTGYEAYLIVSRSVEDAKREACNIEDTHPLGRLFDIDVIGPGGVPVTRQEIGEQPRKCLLCDNPARYCMRNRTHSQEEILSCIERMVRQFAETNE